MGYTEQGSRHWLRFTYLWRFSEAHTVSLLFWKRPGNVSSCSWNLQEYECLSSAGKWMACGRHLAEQDDLSTHRWPFALGNLLQSSIRLPLTSGELSGKTCPKICSPPPRPFLAISWDNTLPTMLPHKLHINEWALFITEMRKSILMSKQNLCFTDHNFLIKITKLLLFFLVCFCCI